MTNGGANLDLFNGLFGDPAYGYKSYYKAGMMYSDSWTGPLFHVAGISEDVVYAVMSRASDSGNVWGLKSALVRALATVY